MRKYFAFLVKYEGLVTSTISYQINGFAIRNNFLNTEQNKLTYLRDELFFIHHMLQMMPGESHHPSLLSNARSTIIHVLTHFEIHFASLSNTMMY